MPWQNLRAPLRKEPLRAAPLRAVIAALAPHHLQRPVPHRQVLDPRLAHVVRLPADENPAPWAGMLLGGLHHLDSPPARRLFARHDLEPRQVEQHRRSVIHRMASRLIASDTISVGGHPHVRPLRHAPTHHPPRRARYGEEGRIHDLRPPANGGGARSLDSAAEAMTTFDLYGTA